MSKSKLLILAIILLIGVCGYYYANVYVPAQLQAEQIRELTD